MSASFPGAAIAQVTHQAVVDAGFTFPSLDLAYLRFAQVDAKLTVYLADESTPSLLRLSANGQKVDTLARGGAGPGEVRNFEIMGWKADSLWFFDYGLGRYTVFTPAGAYARDELYTVHCNKSPRATLNDGSCIEWVDRRAYNARATDPMPPLQVVVIDKVRQRSDTIGTIGYSHTRMQFDNEGGGKMVIPQSFPDDELMVATRHGDALLWIERRAATSARVDSFSVRRWVPGKGWESRKQFSYRPQPLERRVVDSTLTAFGKQLESEKLPVTVDSVLKRSYRPAFRPPVADVQVASDRTTWIRLDELSPPAGLATWLVLDQSLRPIRRVHAPLGMRIVDAQGDLIYGVVTDADDVPALVRYKVVRR